ARHRAVRAAGEREEALGVLGDERERRARLGLLARELRRGDRATEAPPADAIARDEHQMPEVERLDLSAVERTNAGILRGVPETHRAVEAVRVGERERIHPSLDRRRDELVHIGGTIEEAVI